MDRDTAIEIKDVSKSYKSVEALRDISFNIRKGELFGLIGPDGAGKTTLFRILTTLTLPDHERFCTRACKISQSGKYWYNCLK